MQTQPLTECESALLQTKMDLKSILSEDVCVHALPPDATPPMLCGGVSRSGGGGVPRSGGGGVSRFGEGVPQRDASAPPKISAISTSSFDLSVHPKSSAHSFEKVELKASYTSSLRPHTLVP